MRKSSVAALVLCAALPASLQPAAAEGRGAGAGYNGTWSVQLVTESGLCDSRYTVALAIDGGAVRVASTEEGGASVSGRIGSDGQVGLTVRHGSASGAASGRLQANSGSGTWSVSALCSGRWTAQRRSTRVAQAD
ncbi:hypothetical protein NS228_09020 [Methylobacterium indicum]|uniref:Large exoprotein involved in heme utilization or adhesion n=1 Tax=Methylobacterium indicum TaxID=1775910 RepID=A0A8H8WYN6_9HYPH|nr:hypothetical protein [Methylobacterium indicum]KTS38284.1 hypothetical protein NS229_04065 [Methylobacterium indicum]KTS40856.1 hypothetical protein NS228_09020 [Methylobacterium indicum]KTS52701.1 hypothetical protein NS230_08795 [Methylobacterium indicum]BCM87070.1 hypothetical protein mvi_55310 [Methylobacterium indicum]